MITTIAPNPPRETILIASFDLPSRTILCPGKIDTAVPSSGTPRSIDGTNSIRACAMDIATKNTHRNSGEKIPSKNADEAKIIAPAVLTWIPGIIPVTAPHKIPKKQAKIRSSILSPLQKLKSIYNQLNIRDCLKIYKINN